MPTAIAMRLAGFLVLVLLASEVPVCGAASPGGAETDSLLAGVLAIAGLDPADIGFRTDYEDRDEFRLRLIDDLLVNPRHTPAAVDSLARKLSADPVRAAAEALRGEVLPAGGLRPGFVGPHYDDLAAAFTDLADRIDEGSVRNLWRAAFAGLTPEELSTLRADGPELLRFDEDEAARTIDEVAVAEAEGEAAGERVLAAAAKIDRRRLLQAAEDLALAAWSVASAAPRGLGRGDIALPPWDGPPPAMGDVLGVYRLADGRPAVLGGPGPTRYAEPCGLILDLGGDDVYEAGAGGNGGTPGVAAVAIDVAGNDAYRGDAPFMLAAGMLGAGILIDLAGNDLYAAGDCALGAGFCGLGLLDDRGGEDRYLGGTFTCGAGAFGMGVLRDQEGRDLYQGSAFTQGFGFVWGVGFLEDRAGEDIYLCQPRFSDLLRDATTTLSMAQGFGYGLRPHASGGIGLLVDGGGHDRYMAEVFAQGSAYWCALGGIVDRGGNDHYDGFNYTQGSGVHVAVAALVDEEGDDLYRTKGVSQGCGHDLALGALIDGAGNDRYDASDLSQGAGNANGAGLLIDRAGDDVYTVRNATTSQGYGNLRRHRGSIGLLIDAGGADDYLGDGAGDGRLWQEGEHGIGIDGERDWIAVIAELAQEPWPLGGAPPELGPAVSASPPTREPLEGHPAMAPAESVPDSFRTMSFERLFHRAATGEPRFTVERDQARTEIVRRGKTSARELADRLGTDVARERHTIKDLALLLGPDMVEKEFARVLLGADERAARGAAWCLERIEAEGVEKELMSGAKHASWRVRAGSLVALGRGGGRASVHVLIAGLSDADASTRQAAAYALGERLELGRADAEASARLEAAVPALVEAMKDPSPGVRLAAGHALGRAGPQATADLAALIWAEEDPSRRLLAIDAMGAGGDPRAADVLRALLPAVAANIVAASHVEVALARIEGEVYFEGTEGAALSAGLMAQESVMVPVPRDLQDPHRVARARASILISEEAKARAAIYCRRPDCMPAERGRLR